MVGGRATAFEDGMARPWTPWTPWTVWNCFPAALGNSRECGRASNSAATRAEGENRQKPLVARGCRQAIAPALTWRCDRMPGCLDDWSLVPAPGGAAV